MFGLKHVAAMAIGASLLGAAAGCGSDESGAGDSEAGEVKIGALYPLSGPVGAQGLDTLHGAELAAKIVNESYPDLELPLADGEGLPGLDGAKLELLSEDTKGDPQTGASAVDRLVTDEEVAAVVGSYQSAVTLTASQNAERLGVPFVNGESSSPQLTERGLKWFFRTGPSDISFAETFFDYIETVKEQGNDVERIAIFRTNDTYGNDGAEVTRMIAEEQGYEVAADVSFEPTATDLTSQVQQLRAADPDVVFVLAYTDGALLLTKTFEQLQYTPPAVLAYGAGFSDPNFVTGAGALAAGMSTRAAWSLDLAAANPTAEAIAEMFEKEYGAPMTENSARSFTAVMVLAMAIDAAGSTDSEAIRAALAETSLSADETIMPWKGVEFDESGQNTLAGGVVQQLVVDKGARTGTYRVVFPVDVATAKPVWPIKPVG